MSRRKRPGYMEKRVKPGLLEGNNILVEFFSPHTHRKQKYERARRPQLTIDGALLSLTTMLKQQYLMMTAKSFEKIESHVNN